MTAHVALVTGSSRGLGREIALRFARGGWNIVVNCIYSVDKANAVAEEVRAFGAEAVVVQADVGDPASHGGLVGAAMDRWGRLDCLVNNAGVACDVPLLKLSEEAWDAVMATDLLGPLALARRAATVMKPGSSIVNITSMCGLWGCSGAAGYSAAKAGLAALAPGMAPELLARGIRINTVAPGYMPTDMGRNAPQAMERAQGQHPMHRLADPARAAEFIFRLAHTLRVSGQLFVLDGRIR